MGVLTEDKIKAFLAFDGGYGGGSGSGSANGNGNGYGDGYNRNEVFPIGAHYGYGRGYGCGNGHGSGQGCGWNDGISEICGHTVYNVDGLNTIITSIHNNIAEGFILERNTKLVPCYIVKENNKFAHGNTLHEAFNALKEKLYDDSTEEERIEAFKKKFPKYDTKYSNEDLFTYHHILTGSCRMGRESFIKENGLSLEGKTTVREFVELTKNAYGGEIIRLLPQEYY